MLSCRYAGTGSHAPALRLVFKQIWWCWFRLCGSFWRTTFKKRPFGYYGNDKYECDRFLINAAGLSASSSNYTRVESSLQIHAYTHTHTHISTHLHTEAFHMSKYCKRNKDRFENGGLVTFNKSYCALFHKPAHTCTHSLLEYEILFMQNAHTDTPALRKHSFGFIY